MPPLVDTDVFTKLGVAGLLEQALALFGSNVADCMRLPALPSMLERGKIPKLYGQAACAALIPLAQSMKMIPPASTEWLDPLVDVPKIDPGEAQLFACAAEASVIIVTGDKNALVALAGVAGYGDALTGRIVTLEALLLALCDKLGHDTVRTALQPLLALPKGEQTIKICFSAGNSNPREALQSYFDALKREVQPLVLWEPPMAALGVG